MIGIPKPLVQTNQVFIVLTTFLGLIVNIQILLLPIIIGAITLILKKNPIFLVAKNFLRKPMTSYILEDPDQQRFNQWIATISLTLAYIAFLTGYPIVGYAFSIMVILAASIALMGYCIGCTMRFQYQQWKYRRKKKQEMQ